MLEKTLNQEMLIETCPFVSYEINGEEYADRVYRAYYPTITTTPASVNYFEAILVDDVYAIDVNINDWEEIVITSNTFNPLIKGIDIFVLDEIVEQDIFTDMVKHDYIVQMKPKNEFKLKVKIKVVEKASPHIVTPEEN